MYKNNSGNWAQVKKIVASDRAAEDLFGSSVAISGNYMIIGAYADDEDATGKNTFNGSGSAYIFKNNAGNWVQLDKIVASDRSYVDRFGEAVAISGDYAIVGAFLNRRTPQEGILSHHRGRHTFLKIMQEVGNKSVKLLHPTEIQMIDLENPLPFMGIMQ